MPNDAQSREARPEAWPRSSALLVVFAAAWIALTLGLVEPLQAALPNWDELSVDAATMLTRLGLVVFVLLAGLVPVSLATHWLAPLRAPALWLALCAALWAQGDLFVWNYGTFDGSPLDWSAHRGKGWLELAAWSGLLALALWKSAWIATGGKWILAAIAVLQLAGLLGTLQHNAPYQTKLAPAASASAPVSEFVRFSSRKNAIVVVLDALQSDVFAAAIQSPELAGDMPEGFVYYRNAISTYLSTKFSLQSILTSRWIPDQVDALNWRAWAMRSSLPIVLGRRGFDSRLATFSPRALACDRSIPGLSCTPLAEFGIPNPLAAFEAEWRAEVSLLLRLAVFRLVPHVLKPRVYSAGVWRVPEAFPRAESGTVDPKLPAATRTDLEALGYLTANLRVADVAPRFRFIHLNSVHFPARAGARCEASEQRQLRRRQVETAQCMLGELFRFLRALDEAGAYDASLVVVVADHGSHQLKGVDMRVADPPLEPAAAAGRGALQNWWRALPLFLVKQPGARGPMRTSDHPVSLCDVPASVLDSLGIEAAGVFECESVRSPGRRGPRLHYSYNETERQKRLPRSKRYRYNFRPLRVEGHSWNASSWKFCRDGCRAEAALPGPVPD